MFDSDDYKRKTYWEVILLTKNLNGYSFPTSENWKWYSRMGSRLIWKRMKDRPVSGSSTVQSGKILQVWNLSWEVENSNKYLYNSNITTISVS